MCLFCVYTYIYIYNICIYMHIFLCDTHTHPCVNLYGNFCKLAARQMKHFWQVCVFLNSDRFQCLSSSRTGASK